MQIFLGFVTSLDLTLPVSPGAGCSVTDAGEQRGSYNTQISLDKYMSKQVCHTQQSLGTDTQLLSYATSHIHFASVVVAVDSSHITTSSAFAE